MKRIAPLAHVMTVFSGVLIKNGAALFVCVILRFESV